MKANNGSGNIEERDNWETPKWFFDILNRQYKFTFDCCASKNNSKCNVFTNEFEFYWSIRKDWICWMNPPFSKAEKMFKTFFDKVNRGVAIYRCDNMETKIWQNIVLKNADWIFIPKGRISYEGKVGKGSRFPSALIGIGIEPPKELNGYTLFTVNTENNK